MKTPKPSANYIQAQEDYSKIVGVNYRPRTPEHSARRKALYSQMEKEFMAAWKLVSDQREAATTMRRELTPGVSDSESGLDHCSCYNDPANARLVIVAQPYGKFTDELKEALTLGTCSPEVIHAPEWTFYYPSRAQLHLIFFPQEYPTVLPTNSWIRAEHGFN